MENERNMINGIINVYKEAGFTSFDVVAKLRGITHIRKIGHTGTLDPDATGVLPVCIGSATKLCDMLTDKTKEYEATFRLGLTTDTQDISGKVLTESEVNITKKELETCIMSFVGKQQQIPPMYSALKVNGQKLYDLARAGKEVERKPRDIEITGIEIVDIRMKDEAEASGDDICHEAVIRVGCSKGTYIRTLCHDIGQKLGCGATMTRLIRTKSGQFDIEKALKLSEIEELVKTGNIEEHIIAVDEVFSHCPKINVVDDDEKKVLNGNFIKREYCGDRIRVYLSNGDFAAIYDYSKENRRYVPFKMFLA